MQYVVKGPTVGSNIEATWGREVVNAIKAQHINSSFDIQASQDAGGTTLKINDKYKAIPDSINALSTQSFGLNSFSEQSLFEFYNKDKNISDYKDLPSADLLSMDMLVRDNRQKDDGYLVPSLRYVCLSDFIESLSTILDIPDSAAEDPSTQSIQYLSVEVSSDVSGTIKVETKTTNLLQLFNFSSAPNAPSFDTDKNTILVRNPTARFGKLAESRPTLEYVTIDTLLSSVKPDSEILAPSHYSLDYDTDDPLNRNVELYKFKDAETTSYDSASYVDVLVRDRTGTNPYLRYTPLADLSGGETEGISGDYDIVQDVVWDTTTHALKKVYRTFTYENGLVISKTDQISTNIFSAVPEQV